MSNDAFVLFVALVVVPVLPWLAFTVWAVAAARREEDAVLDQAQRNLDEARRILAELREREGR